MAYGHLVLSPQASVVYYTTGQNSAKHTHSIVWDDPDLCIQWPTTVPPTLSAADRKGAFFSWWTMPKDSTFGAL
jgi:dTDP-4-dehydrorhamnose 3,5-epimerase